MKLIQSKDRLLQQLQTNVKEVLDPIQSNLLNQGHFIKNVSLLSGTTNTIKIGLEQPLNGWIVTRKNSDSNIWDIQSSNNTPSQTLLLQCSSNVLIDLYVF